jgi:DNA-binding helix-hairpin-helix protein with protein kinase domain
LRLQLEKGGALISVEDPPLAIGGEATLYLVPGVDALVAKIYHDPTPERAAKLMTMIDVPPTDPMAAHGHPSIAWPLHRLLDLDQDGRCVGYVMPRVKHAHTIFEYYNPRTRLQLCPLFHYRYLIRTARNLAAAFRALHDRGYVVGDVNESNLLVTETALVTLVDTDSFQVRTPLGVFRCPVGKPEFTPPELQGVSFREVDRKIADDLFGLAVLIFLLLMEGTHPYAGRYEGEGEPAAIGDRIAQGYYVYGVNQRNPYKPMPLAPPIGILYPEIRSLMQQCFQLGHLKPAARPTAAEWQQALDRAERNLTVCKVNPQHFYRLGFGSCPWCARRKLLGGRDPFPVRDEIVRDHLPVLTKTPSELPAEEPPPTPATT